MMPALQHWWRAVVPTLPIVGLARSLRATRSPGAIVLTGALALYGLIASLTPLSSALQEQLIANSHYRPTSLLTWALLQPAPKMYGFANRVWIGPAPSLRQMDARSFWVNHYPVRMARFDGERGALFSERTSEHVFVRTTYRGQTLWTAVHVERTPAGLRWQLDPGWRPRP